MPEYTTRELTPEEKQVLAEELEAVLIKHNAEMQITSNIRLLRREPIENGTDSNTTEENKEEAVTTPDESGTSGGEESPKR